MNTDIVIIGAGLAGLALARRLEDSRKDYLILEARDRKLAGPTAPAGGLCLVSVQYAEPCFVGCGRPSGFFRG